MPDDANQPEGFEGGANESRGPSHEARGLGRRELLKALGTVPAALLPLSAPPTSAAAQPTPAAEPAPEPYQPRVLSPHEWKTVQLLSDLIIPADERSGSATQAGVPEFIDDWLAFKGGWLLAQIRGGLVWLDMTCNREFHHDFADCSPAEQKQLLDRIAYPKRAAPEDLPGVTFFNHMRDLVVAGFFSSKMGVEDLPYLGNQMVTRWEGCPTHVLEKLGLKS
jgi:gluconate 2-dehydrogenase gamma chain